jgi:hypothetical protein
MDSGLGFSKNEVESSNVNRITLSGTSAVFGVPTTPQPPTPTSTSAGHGCAAWSSRNVAHQARAIAQVNQRPQCV